MEQKAKHVGKFNIIDIIAVILIVAVILFVGVKFMNRGSGTEPADMIEVTYTVRVEGAPNELYESCKSYLPDKLLAKGALVPGQIESVEKVPFKVLSPDGTWVNDPEHVTLLFKVTTETPDAPVLMTKVGDQEIRIGKTHILKGEHIEFLDTQIVDVEWNQTADQQN